MVSEDIQLSESGHSGCLQAGAGENNSISGHMFSRDLLEWTVSPIEPYDNAVQFADGTTQRFSTMERPKLLWSHDGGSPIALLNGVSPVYPCDSCNQARCGGDAPVGGGCCWCKVTPGEDCASRSVSCALHRLD